ncbi:hypothetical protein Tco_1199883, partial [Tanacetum coccineum]
SLEGDNSRKDTTSSEIYETVRSEVRRAIAVIQDNLQDVIILLAVHWEHSSRVDIKTLSTWLSTSQPPPYTVEDGIGTHNPSKTVLELLYFRIITTAIRRNTSVALVSTEVTDASKLVKPDAVGLKNVLGNFDQIWLLRNIVKILKETLPEPKTSSSHMSRGRKSRVAVTDEAMLYFDECVSISTFDSSNFSAAEDPPVNSLTTTPIRGTTSSDPNRCISQ